MTNSYQLTNKTSNLFKDKVDIKVKKNFQTSDMQLFMHNAIILSHVLVCSVD